MVNEDFMNNLKRGRGDITDAQNLEVERIGQPRNQQQADAMLRTNLQNIAQQAVQQQQQQQQQQQRAPLPLDTTLAQAVANAIAQRGLTPQQIQQMNQQRELNRRRTAELPQAQFSRLLQSQQQNIGRFDASQPSAIPRAADSWGAAIKTARRQGQMNIVSQGQQPRTTSFFTGVYGQGVPNPAGPPPRAAYFSNQDPVVKQALLLAVPGSKMNAITGAVSLPTDFQNYFNPRKNPTPLSIQNAQKLTKSMVQPRRIVDLIGPILTAVNQNMVAAGYQPMGPVGKNTAPLYLGRYYDPKTNRVKTIKNPKTITYNPTNKEQVYGYLINAIAHKWNQVIRLIDKMNKAQNPRFQEIQQNKWQKKIVPVARYRQQMQGYLNKLTRGVWKPYNTATEAQKALLIAALNTWNYSDMFIILRNIARRKLRENQQSQQKMSPLEKKYWEKLQNIQLIAGKKISLAAQRMVLQKPAPLKQVQTMFTDQQIQDNRDLMPSLAKVTVPRPYVSLGLPRFYKSGLIADEQRNTVIQNVGPRRGELRMRNASLDGGFPGTVVRIPAPAATQ